MSSLARKFSKQITKSCLRFPNDMYNNIVGSLIIANWILTPPETQSSIDFIKSEWRKIKRIGLEHWLDDVEFIPATLAKFKLKPHYGQFAMVIGKNFSNVLFAPYDSETKLIYPIREDGIYTPTLKHGKIYPIDDKQTETPILTIQGSEAENENDERNKEENPRSNKTDNRRRAKKTNPAE